jgi:phosphatidylglycerol---prolipoprotein diacylglyceryl transferase
LEYLAFFVGFRYYVWLRQQQTDKISNSNRLSIILGAIFGALFGSRFMGFLENPMITLNAAHIVQLLNTKSIMGGLFGGLLGVELSKKIIKEQQSSGDLFTYPLIVGIMIGRVGCFLSGVKESTYGTPTTFITGMDLGDGISRHPTSLYEIIFLLLLFMLLKRIEGRTKGESGLLFKIFMLAYFGFRFCIEFIKPNSFYVVGWSSIQWLCIICWLYYLPTFKKIIHHAR